MTLNRILNRLCNTGRAIPFFLIVVSLLIPCNVVSTEWEIVEYLFNKEVVAEPNSYASIQGQIAARGTSAVDFLTMYQDKTESWYERAIANALTFKIVSPNDYECYQIEFDKWSCDRFVPRWFDSPSEYPWGKSKLISRGKKTVPFLIEKLFFEPSRRISDRTVVGWHRSRPKETAIVFLQHIGGRDAARSVAICVINGLCVSGFRDSDLFFVTKRTSGEQFYVQSKLFDSELIGQIDVQSKLTDSELIDQMILFLKKDDSEPLAAWVLGEFADPRTIEPLIESISGKNVAQRSFSAIALAKIGKPAIPSLIDALSSPNGETRSWAEVALTKMGRIAVQPLVKLLYKGPSIADRYAVGALRFIGDKDGVPALILALKNPDLYVVGEAARALGEIGDPNAIEPLLKALENPKNWHESGASIFGIAGALAQFKEPRAFDRLAQLAQHENWLVRRSAIEALPDVGRERSLPILLELIKHEHESTRGDAAIALGKLRDRKAVPALISALSDSESFVCSWAAWSLGEIGDARALPYLRKMASETKGYLNKTANEAIDKIEDSL